MDRSEVIPKMPKSNNTARYLPMASAVMKKWQQKDVANIFSAWFKVYMYSISLNSKIYIGKNILFSLKLSILDYF